MAIVLCGLGAGCGLSSMNPSLAVYTSEQTDSSHSGYRRTIVSSKGTIFVNDFEEASLQLTDPDPREVVGRRPWGDGKVCAIPGQSLSAYLAVDMGSEMPAYEVFRNLHHPPFDWRHASFQRMRLAVSEGPAANKETTDPALIDDVLRALREGTPAQPPLPPLRLPVTGSPTRMFAVLLFSNQLPGLVFRPSCYLEESGKVYLSESILANFTGNEQMVKAEWIPAGNLFARWVQPWPLLRLSFLRPAHTGALCFREVPTAAAETLAAASETTRRVTSIERLFIIAASRGFPESVTLPATSMWEQSELLTH